MGVTHVCKNGFDSHQHSSEEPSTLTLTMSGFLTYSQEREKEKSAEVERERLLGQLAPPPVPTAARLKEANAKMY